MNETELWFGSPAMQWTDALPLGNGRLGAMAFGGVARDEFQLNESTLWSGGPYQPANAEALTHLGAVRRLVSEGSYAEAQTLANTHLMARPYLQMSYQPAGHLYIDVDHPTLFEDYRRSLDLDTAVATTSYRCAGASFTRTAFVSASDNIMVVRLSADRPGVVNAGVELASPQHGEVRLLDGGLIKFTGRNGGEHGVDGALTLSMRAKVLPDGGTMAAKDMKFRVYDANAIVVLLDIGTSFVRYDDVSGDPEARIDERLAAVSSRSYDELLEAHLAEHRRLFRRLRIDLGRTAAAELPTGERVARFATGGDPALAALYVQYGRYLMVTSSRPGTQPATLQGIWNREARPPWGSKYTTNINLQMNYWLPDVANLAECFEPLLVMLEELSVTGQAMARTQYDARGWVLHHNTDLWRATGPVDGAQWGLWPTGGAWLCAQAWEHAAFAGFPDNLVERLYPVLKGASEFFLDILQELPGTGLLVTNPSLSPENVHPMGASVCAGPAMDNQILRDLFSATIEAGRQLSVDASFLAELQETRSRLPGDRIGKAGQLQEWLEDWDMEAPEPRHRHVSHLYGVYPGRQIGSDTPALMAAARRSLELRGDDATGWGIGWRINLWARLRDGDRAFAVLIRLLHPDRSYRNLFDAHPPFQIDGNFGGASGILEMLVQSSPGRIELLPAVPSCWPGGRLAGVRVWGGIELDFAWERMRVVSLELRSRFTRTVIVSLKDRTLRVNLEANEAKKVSAEELNDPSLRNRLIG